ncbi:MAG: hypothetical protein WB767_11210 [Nocardioides sp.]
MENIKNPMTSGIALGSASAIALPMHGCAFGTRSVDFAGTTSAARTRQDVVNKGHMGLVAYVPGIHAWSPPIC